MDTGLLIIRLVVGLTVAAHGGQILFGWKGPGLRGTASHLAKLGYRPGALFAPLLGVTLFVGGVCLALGLLTPLASAATIAAMLGAIFSTHVRNGFWITNNGFEYSLVLAVVALGISFTGPGQISADHALGWSLSGNAWGILALAAGLPVALATEGYRRRNESLVVLPSESEESEKRAA